MRYAISDVPIIKRMLRSRWLQWSLTALTLLFFVLAIIAGLVGTPAGNRNFGIVFVWIVWWALLILLLLPFAGRLWCGVCPIPAPGEWLQRRALVQPRPGVSFTPSASSGREPCATSGCKTWASWASRSFPLSS